MQKITDGIYAIEGLNIGRSYLIEDTDGLTLVDTSSAGAAPRILDAITSLGRLPEDLRTIIATHYHFDHTGNVAALVERTGATFCAHADDVPYMNGEKKWMPMKGIFGPISAATQARGHFVLNVDRVLQTGETLPVAGGLQVIHAPGHTPGQIALYCASKRVLFSADAFMNTGGLQLPMWMATHDTPEAKRTIRRLAALDFDIALPGHGTPILSRANEKLGEWSKRWF